MTIGISPYYKGTDSKSPAGASVLAQSGGEGFLSVSQGMMEGGKLCDRGADSGNPHCYLKPKTGRRGKAGGSQAVCPRHGPEKYPGLPSFEELI